MPTYEYRCPEGHAFEKSQKMTDKPRAKCPTCGKAAVRKISGGAALVFKGSGFYITDYGKDGKGPRKDESEKPAAESRIESPKGESSKTESPKGESPKGDAKPGPKSDAQPAPKPAKSGPSRDERKAASE